MTDWLVLGDSPLLSAVGERLSAHSRVRVGTTDENLADAVRAEGVSVDLHAELDESALRTYDYPATVAVFEEESAATLARCRAVRRVFPDVYLTACAGRDSSHPDQLDAVADRVLDPLQLLADRLVRQVDESSHQSRQLAGVLKEIDRLAIVAHDNPDPDAIASGVALARIAEAVGCTAEVCYFGEITHQENRAMVNVLNLDLENVASEEYFEAFDGIALVDHSRPGVNDQLSPETSVDIVIDHHPPRSPIDARYVDLRSDVGATSTLLVDYLDRLDVDIGSEVATALLFGIHVDTDGFSREVCQADFEAAATLVPGVDFATMERIETPTMSATTLDTIASAISKRRVEGEVLLSGVGRLHERDALAQAADRLLGLEGVQATLVYGIKDGTIFISARASGAAEIDLGETLREAFDQIGSAGGHVDMAGAQIQLGVLESVDDEDESLSEIVDAVVRSRFLDVLETQTTYQVEGVYRTEAAMSAEYLATEEEGEDTAETGENDRDGTGGDKGSQDETGEDDQEPHLHPEDA